MTPSPPRSFDELITTFGDIRTYIHSDGSVARQWENDKITRIPLPASTAYAYDAKLRITRVTAHVLIAAIAKQMYQEMYDSGLWEALGPYGGGYEFRANRNNPAILSLHAFGLAWDWNPVEFPNGSTKKRDPKLIKIAAKYGVRWGETFHHPDPMHASFSAGSIG